MPWAGLLPLNDPVSSSPGVVGQIQVEANRWQLIAVPTIYGYWDAGTNAIVNDGITVAKIKNYVVDQLEDKYGAGCVTVANAYIGDVDAFYNYVPGVTPEGSVNNFPLMYYDSGGGYYEPVGFWLKSNLGSDMTIEWSSS